MKNALCYESNSFWNIWMKPGWQYGLVENATKPQHKSNEYIVWLKMTTQHGWLIMSRNLKDISGSKFVSWIEQKNLVHLATENN